MNPITGTAAPIIGSQGAGVSSAFGIANNSHMFNILSSGLYSEKIAAVIREVSCNAMDAHVEAGYPDKPFQVKLPSALDKTFYVKDWGPGLDDDQVRQIYTIYGVSTKQLSDDQTGGFGLGSKSPFAYTLFDPENAHGFTVISVKNGVKRAYVMHLNDNGEPAVTGMGAFPADPDWPSGVMVTFPVQERDFAEFQQKAREIYQWFRVKPEVLGLAEALPTPRFRFEESDFFKMGTASGASQDVPGNYHASPAVVMANVRYPLQAERLGKLSNTAKALLSEGIHFFLPNGEVLMTPNREALQYVDKTRQNLLARLEQAKLEMAQRVRVDVMTPEKTRLEWLRKVHRYASTLPYHLKHYLPDFLQEAGVADDEVKAVREMLRETTLLLPNWVGHGVRGNADYQFEEGTVKRDAAGVALYAANTGCRVWRYANDPSKGIRKKEVVGGSIDFSRTEPKRVAMHVLGEMHVLYADGPHSDLRARGLLSELAPDAQVLLVQACRGVNARYAREHAEAICGPRGIEGLPCNATSSLAIPQRILDERELRKARKLLSAAELMADEEVFYRPAQNTEAEETTLGELDDDADKFYVVKRGERYTNLTSSDKLMAFRAGKYDTNRMQAIQKMLRLCDVEFSGVVVLSSEGAARRLRLAEQGYRPFLPFAMAEIGKRLPALVKGHDQTAEIPDLRKTYDADQYGMMGLLTHHLLLRTPAWEALEAGLDGHPLLSALADLALRSGVKLNEDPVVAQVRECLSLLRNIDNNGLPYVTLGRMSASEVTKTFNMAYPLLGALKLNSIQEALKATPEKAAALVLAAIELDSPVADSKAEADAKPALALAA